MLFLAKLLTAQVAIVLVGVLVLRRQGYFADYVLGPKTSAGSYALVCPGVAVSVMIQFFVNKELVEAGVIAQFDAVYWGLTALAVLAQIAMLMLVLRLNRQHFRGSSAPALLPAE